MKMTTYIHSLEVEDYITVTNLATLENPIFAYLNIQFPYLVYEIKLISPKDNFMSIKFMWQNMWHIYLKQNKIKQNQSTYTNYNSTFIIRQVSVLPLENNRKTKREEKFQQICACYDLLFLNKYKSLIGNGKWEPYKTILPFMSHYLVYYRLNYTTY